jgi:hypothetical protein
LNGPTVEDGVHRRDDGCPHREAIEAAIAVERDEQQAEERHRATGRSTDESSYPRRHARGIGAIRRAEPGSR